MLEAKAPATAPLLTFTSRPDCSDDAFAIDRLMGP
jgi:hypothetical protein